MGKVGSTELLIILGIILLLFGPQIVRRLGASIREMRRLPQEMSDE